MTRAQLLEALNALGKEPYLNKRWGFALHALCEMEVCMRNRDKRHRQLVLEGAEVASRSIVGASESRLVPMAGGEAQAVTVLETRRRSNTVRARSLLTQLEVRCDNPVVPAA